MVIKVSIIVSLLLLLLLLRFLSVSHYQLQYQDGQSVKFIATVPEEPETKKGKQHVRVRTPHGSPVKLVVPALPEFHYGDKLLITGVFTGSDYKGRIFWSLYYPKVQIIKNEQNIITQSAVLIKSKAKDIFESALPPVPAALLSGILFGGRNGMPEDFLEALRITGVLHVVAASGANVAFVAGALLAIFGKIMRRQYALMLGVFGIAFYAFLAGLEPSIVRAAIMGSIAFSAAILGRQNVSIIALLFTGYVMLLVDPLLVSDVGFQLSFLATMGILLVKPILDRGVERIGRSGGMGDDITTTTAAQIGVLPVLLGTFGQYSLLSVVANAPVLWTIPIVMVLGALGLLVGFIFEPLGKMVVLLILPFLIFFEWIVRGFGSFGGVLQLESFPIALGIGYYLFLLAIVLFLQTRQKHEEKERSLREEIGI